MRWIALIALVDLVVVTAFVAPTTNNIGVATAVALAICILGIPLALIVGFPVLWVSRRLAPGNPILIAVMGTVVGATIPIIVSLGIGGDALVEMGASVGFVSALLWWVFVERHPQRRAHYD